MRPQKDPFPTGCVVLSLVIGIPCGLCGGCLLMASRSVEFTGPATTSRQPTIDHSDAKQKGRTALLTKLKTSGVFTKIDDRGGGLVYLWTGPTFAELTYQDKEQFCGVVYAYCFDGSSFSDSLILRDGRTGKEIGTMTKAGLTMK
jgi:hypothetical protein